VQPLRLKSKEEPPAASRGYQRSYEKPKSYSERLKGSELDSTKVSGYRRSSKPGSSVGRKPSERLKEIEDK
jgi:hypothetical protein